MRGKILHLDDHLERLERSAQALRIALPMPLGALREAALETAALNGMAEAPVSYLRILLSRGSGYLGLRNTSRLGKAHIYVIPQVHSTREPTTIEVYRAASTSVLTPPASTLDPRIKSNNYLWHILALLDAQDRGADLAVHCNAEGYVTECHAMNIFCVRNGRVSTPPEAMALAGITRAHILGVARSAGFDVYEELLTPYDLRTADEVFVTGSLDLVGSVRSIDGTEVPAPVPGAVTITLREAYLAEALEGGTTV